MRICDKEVLVSRGQGRRKSEDREGKGVAGGSGLGGAPYHQAQVALREVDHRRVEVGALVEGGYDDPGGQGRRCL